MAILGNVCVATCRHDNDHINIQDISIAPTQQEVLSQTLPYLPPNRPGTVMHLEQGSQEAHKDLHFRYVSSLQQAKYACNNLADFKPCQDPTQNSPMTECAACTRNFHSWHTHSCQAVCFGVTYVPRECHIHTMMCVVNCWGCHDGFLA